MNIEQKKDVIKVDTDAMPKQRIGSATTMRAKYSNYPTSDKEEH